MMFYSFLILLFVRVIKSQGENFALNRPVFASPSYDNGDDVTLLTDGNWQDKCMWMRNPHAYIIVDLGRTVQLDLMSIRERSYALRLNFDIVTMDEFRWCNVQNMSSWRPCVGDSRDNGPAFEFHTAESDKSNCRGRFIGVRMKKDGNKNVWARTCEVRIYGKVVDSSTSTSLTSNGERCKPLPAGKNILRNKGVTSVSKYYPERLYDGVIEQTPVFSKCFYDKTNLETVINLGGSYNISLIRVWVSRDDKSQWGATVDFDISVGYRDDKGNRVTITVLADIPSAGYFIEASMPTPIRSDFIRISTKKIIGNEYMMICEVEAEGIKIDSETITKNSITPLGPADYPNAVQVRSGVKQVKIPIYGSKVVFIGTNCEPFLPNLSMDQYFGIICKFGTKGRVALFGKEYYFDGSLIDSKLKQNLFQWLSPLKGASAQLKTQLNWKSMEAGDLILFDTEKGLPGGKAEEKELITKAGNEGIGIILQSTQWNEQRSNNGYRNNYQFVLDAIDADFLPNVINWSEMEVPFSDSDYGKFPPSIINALDRMEKSHDEFLRLSKSVYEMGEAMKSMKVTNEVEIKDGLIKILKKYENFVTKNCPTKEFPLQKGEPEDIVVAYSNLLHHQALIDSNIKAPCVSQFPGELNSKTKRFKNLRVKAAGGYKSEYHSTGLYLGAGETMTYNVISISGKWVMYIGCHTKDLRPIAGENNKQMIRYPSIITSSNKLKKGSGKVYSAFGGVVWLESDGKITDKIEMKVSNVAQSVFLNTRNPSAQKVWDKSRNQDDLAPPFAELQGNHFSVCLPSKNVRNLDFEQAKRLFDKYWDPSVDIDHRMRGSDPLKEKMERFSVDIQLPMGYGLSGYSMAGYPDWEISLVNETYIKNEGSWGVLHEIGHNLDVSDTRFEGSTDVTNNIYCLLNWKYIWGWDIYDEKHSRLMKTSWLENINKIQSVDGTINFKNWNGDFFYRLAMFGQLANNFGMGLFQKFYVSITSDSDFKRPDKEEARRDLWYERMSEITDLNLQPLFEFWDFSVSTEAIARQTSKKCFLPLDQLSKQNLLRYSAIHTRFGNNCLTTVDNEKKVNFIEGPVRERPNDVEIDGF